MTRIIQTDEGVGGMTEVPVWRLYLLRAMYLVGGVGLGLTVWPKIIDGAPILNLQQGVVRALLGALSLLWLVGVRYPLQMLPLLFYEIAWKAIWLIAVAYPVWSSGRMDAATLETTRECILVVIVPLLLPWGYIVANYIRRPGDRWA